MVLSSLLLRCHWALGGAGPHRHFASPVSCDRHRFLSSSHFLRPMPVDLANLLVCHALDDKLENKMCVTLWKAV